MSTIAAASAGGSCGRAELEHSHAEWFERCIVSGARTRLSGSREQVGDLMRCWQSVDGNIHCRLGIVQTFNGVQAEGGLLSVGISPLRIETNRVVIGQFKKRQLVEQSR